MKDTQISSLHDKVVVLIVGQKVSKMEFMAQVMKTWNVHKDIKKEKIQTLCIAQFRHRNNIVASGLIHNTNIISQEKVHSLGIPIDQNQNMQIDFFRIVKQVPNNQHRHFVIKKKTIKVLTTRVALKEITKVRIGLINVHKHNSHINNKLSKLKKNSLQQRSIPL